MQGGLFKLFYSSQNLESVDFFGYKSMPFTELGKAKDSFRKHLIKDEVEELRIRSYDVELIAPYSHQSYETLRKRNIVPIPRQSIFPLKRCAMTGGIGNQTRSITFNCPKNSKLMLLYWFGSGYMTPNYERYPSRINPNTHWLTI